MFSIIQLEGICQHQIPTLQMSRLSLGSKLFNHNSSAQPEILTDIYSMYTDMHDSKVPYLLLIHHPNTKMKIRLSCTNCKDTFNLTLPGRPPHWSLHRAAAGHACAGHSVSNSSCFITTLPGPGEDYLHHLLPRIAGSRQQ